MSDFQKEVANRIGTIVGDTPFRRKAAAFLQASVEPNYSYNFVWLGRPVIQYPQGIVAMHELIWTVKPDRIIETGIPHGESLVFSASMLAKLDICENNHKSIEAHPMASRIQIIQGSSVEADIIKQVHEIAVGYKRVLVCLDSNNTHDHDHDHGHALAELHAYASLTSRGSYCVIFDTLVQDIPKEVYPDRPWGLGNNPKTAVWEFLKTAPEFEIDKSIPDKLQITIAPVDYLKQNMRQCRRVRSPVGQF